MGYEEAILSSTGVEADEIACKIAINWAYHKKNVHPNKAKIVFPKNNFWGRTIAASGASNDPGRFHNYGPYGLNSEMINFNDIEAFENVLKSDPNIAAYLVETI